MKNNKKHPLTFFREANEKAHKKADSEMAKFRKSLPQKGEGGRWHAPMVLPENPQTASPVEGPMNNPMIGPTDLKINYGAPILSKPRLIQEEVIFHEPQHIIDKPLHKDRQLLRRIKKG